MTSRFEEVYRFKSDDVLTDEALNRRFKDLDDRLSKAEVVRLSEDEAFAVVLDRVLERSEGVISNLRDQLLDLTELQWLTAQSETPRTLALEATFALSVIEEDRALFAPGPFALLSWTGGDPDHYAIVRTLGFDRGLGQWDVKVEAFVGDPGPHAEWQISAVAGATLAQMALLAQGQAVGAEILAFDADMTAKHGDVVAKHADVVAKHGEVVPARDQALLAAAAMLPWDFTADGQFWTAQPQGAPLATPAHAGPFATEAGLGRVLQSNAAGQAFPRGVIVPVPGRRYRIEVRAKVKTDKNNGLGGLAAIDLYSLAADFGTPVALGGFGVLADAQAVAGYSSSDADFTVADGLKTFALDYLAPAAPPPIVRPRFAWNQGGSNAVVQVVSFLIYDVTAAYDANALATQLDAASLAPKNNAQLSGTFALTGDATPAQLVANANDYAPAELASASILRVSADQAGRQVTGLGGGADGRFMILENVGNFPILLVDQAAASTAANRFLLGANYGLEAGASVLLRYDVVAQRWRLVGQPDPSPFRNFAVAAALSF